MKNHTPNLSASYKLAWVFACIMLIMVGTLLAWIQQSRFGEYMVYQQRIMQGSVEGTAEEIGLFMSELRRSAHMFAESERGMLNELASHPDNDALHEQLNQSLHSHFPEAFTFTIADRNGIPLLVDYDGLLGDVCIKDLKKFAADRRHSEVYIHPQPSAYHFDIMVDREQEGKPGGIFFITFSTDLLSKILKHGQAPDHKLMLLHRYIPGLIEVTDGGPRIKLDRDFKLSLEEMQTIGFSTPIPGTAWNLVDIPAPGLFQGARTRFQNSALLVMLVFILVSAIMLGLLFRTYAKNKRLKHLYTHDAQTGLPNRYLLIERLQQLIANAHDISRFSLLFIELGEIRHANATFFDRPNINDLLKHAGERIQALLPPDGTLAHLAGQEFAVLLANASEVQAAQVAQAIQTAFSQPLEADVTTQGINIGIAVYPEHGKDFETLIQRANMTLQTAKRRQHLELT